MDRENHTNNGEDERDVENEGLLDGKEIERYWSEVSEKNMTFREPLLVKRVNTTSQIAIVGSNVCTIESLDYEYAVFPYTSSSALACLLCSFMSFFGSFTLPNRLVRIVIGGLPLGMQTR